MVASTLPPADLPLRLELIMIRGMHAMQFYQAKYAK
jgi:hypothetical protein